MLNALIVVWRESLEAMLVVGVLLAWIARQEDASRLRRTLWSGVGGGTLLALALAFLAYGAQTWLDGESLELFQIGMLLLACVLMTQMVMWMRRHGASMKRELEAGASRAAETGGRLGVALVAALAIGREGMEPRGVQSGRARHMTLRHAELCRADAESQPDQLRHVDNRHILIARNILLSFLLEHIQLHLAKRTRSNNTISTFTSCISIDRTSHTHYRIMSRVHSMETTAIQLTREINRRSTDSRDNISQASRNLEIFKTSFLLRTEQMATIILSYAQTAKRFNNLSLQIIQTIITNQYP